MTFQVSARTRGPALRTPARRTVSPCERRSTGFSVMVSTTVLMLLLLPVVVSVSSVVVVALAQAAPGQVEEDVVERRADDLDPP